MISSFYVQLNFNNSQRMLHAYSGVKSHALSMCCYDSRGVETAARSLQEVGGNSHIAIIQVQMMKRDQQSVVEHALLAQRYDVCSVDHYVGLHHRPGLFLP